MGDKNQTRKSSKSLILKKVMLHLLKKKKAYTMDTYRNLTKKKERKKTNVLPINGTHSCYIYCGRLYFLSLTPLKHQQHFYNINKKNMKKSFYKSRGTQILISHSKEYLSLCHLTHCFV